MRWRSLYPVMAAALITGMAGGLLAEPAGDAGEAAPDAAAKEGEFDIPLPQGMPVRGIKIPHRDEKGNLVMVIEAKVANRLDDTQIAMEELKIEVLDDDGRKIFVELPRGIFNLTTRVLTGDHSALIRREDFEVTGDSVEFNTRTRHGTLRGNIKMTLQTADITPS